MTRIAGFAFKLTRKFRMPVSLVDFQVASDPSFFESHDFKFSAPGPAGGRRAGPVSALLCGHDDSAWRPRQAQSESLTSVDSDGLWSLSCCGRVRSQADSEAPSSSRVGTNLKFKTSSCTRAAPARAAARHSPGRRARAGRRPGPGRRPRHRVFHGFYDLDERS
jgi:hypothetical protein